MGYFLGKNNTGDLASVLTGAYNSSSPTLSVPRGSAQPLSPLNALTSTSPGGPGTPPGPPPTVPPGPPPSVPPDKAKCWLECFGKGYREGTPQMVTCIDDCVNRGGGDCVAGKACWSAMDCPGGECVGASLEPGKNKQGACKCSAPKACTTAADCPEGFACIGGKCERLVPCKADADCQPGYTCVNGSCQGGTTTGCPEGTGDAYEGCPCGHGYSTVTGKCPTGYVFIKRDNPADWKPGIPYVEGAVGTCQCQKAIDDWRDKKKGQLGEYTYPPEMQALMDLLLARGKEFMGLTPGFSQEAQDKMFGRGFETVRGQEAGQRAGLEQGLSRQGMLGTGAGQGMLNDLSWQTEGNVANLARDLFVQNEMKKKQDLLDYSGAAQSMLGSGMGFQQLLEAINSSRRGEGSAALQSLLAWLMSQK